MVDDAFRRKKQQIYTLPEANISPEKYTPGKRRFLYWKPSFLGKPHLLYIPRTQLTSIFEGQPSKTRPFPIKTRVIWVLGIYSKWVDDDSFLSKFAIGLVPLPETNGSPLKIGGAPKVKYQPSIFRCYVSFRECISNIGFSGKLDMIRI